MGEKMNQKVSPHAVSETVLVTALPLAAKFADDAIKYYVEKEGDIDSDQWVALWLSFFEDALKKMTLSDEP